MKLPQIQHYEFVELIGEGSCGYVYRCRYRERDERIVKLVKAMSVNQGLFVNGMKTVAAARAHPHLVDVCDYRFSESPSYVITSIHGHLPTEGGWQADTIEPLLGRLPTDQAMRLIDQMVDGLAHLHFLEVPHTAFKPSNIFIDRQADGSRRVRIADWSEGYMQGASYLELGDRGFYAAPEQLAKGDAVGGRPKAWDVYAFGVVAYRLLTGLLPRLDPQFDDYVEALKSGEAAALASPDGGGIVTDPARYVEWMHGQPDVSWGGPAPTQVEADRRKVIERCLHIDPAMRFGDMREVMAEFRDVESSALLRRMQRDMSARHQQQVDEVEQRVATTTELASRHRRLLFRWRAYAAGIVLAVGLLGWGAFRLAQREMRVVEGKFEDLQNEQIKRLAEQKLRYDIALAEKETTVASVARSAVRNSNAVDAARSVQERAQFHGDQLFEMLLNQRDSDVPGYREERRRLLVDARGYYESMLEVYANDASALRRSADGYRYLSEIYLELGDARRAQSALTQAAQRFSTLITSEAPPAADAGQASAGAAEPLNAHIALAEIRQLQAELAIEQKPADNETLLAIDGARSQWAALATAQPKQVDWRLNRAEGLLLRADVLEAGGDEARALVELQSAADELVLIHEEAPNNDRAKYALGRTFAALARKLVDRGDQAQDQDLEQAQALLEQSVVLFSDAITLNSAVDDYQASMAESLAQLGIMQRNLETLQDAVTVLNVTLNRDPKNLQAASALAGSLGVMAEMQRDGGESAAALELEKRAVGALQTAMTPDSEGGGVNGGSSARQVRMQFAERNCHLSEIYGDIDQYSEAKKAADDAIKTTAAVLRETPADTRVQRLLARAQGLAAYASEKVGNKEEARALYTAALTQWQAVAKTDPADAQAVDGQSWAKRQLDALK